MSYAELEASIDSGQPVELYEFTLGAQAWRYTSGQESVSYAGQTYTPETLRRTEPEQSNEVQRQNLQVTARHDLPVALLFVAWSPPGEVLLRVWRCQGDPNTVAPWVVWMGRVVDVAWTGDDATLTVESIYTAIRAAGLRRMYSKLCPHVLYGPMCQANPAAHGANTTVSQVDGMKVLVGVLSGNYEGGMLAWTDAGGVLQRRMILWLDGAWLVLAGARPELAPGHAVTAYPGCDRQFATCRDVFGNTDNYGGFPWLPGTNPFSASAGAF